MNGPFKEGSDAACEVQVTNKAEPQWQSAQSFEMLAVLVITAIILALLLETGLDSLREYFSIEGFEADGIRREK